MKTEDIRRFITDNVSADDFSCLIREVDSHETRFAQNGITQHLAGPKMSITLSLSFGKKSGSSSTNQNDEKSLRELIKTAEDIARLAPEDPEHMPSAKEMKLPEGENLSQATLKLTPETMVDIVQRSIDKARAMDAQVLKETGYHGVITIEREVGAAPVADISLAVDYLRRTMRKGS